MIDVVALLQLYIDEGYEPSDALNAVARDLDEAERDFIEEYEDRPDVQYGWHQQDLIDLRRFER